MIRKCRLAISFRFLFRMTLMTRTVTSMTIRIIAMVSFEKLPSRNPMPISR